MRNIALKKILFLLVLVIPCCSIIKAQENARAIDSLNLIVKRAASDSSLAFAYLGLSEILYVSNLDTMKFLCNKSKNIAEKKLAQTGLSKQEIRTYSRILSMSLANIGYYYGEVGNIEEQKRLYLQSLELIKKVGSKLEIAEILSNVGYLYGELGDIEKQKEYYFEGLRIREEEADKKSLHVSYSNIGHVYFNQGNLPVALDYLFKALKIQEELDSKEDISNTLNSIGYIHGQQGEIEKQKEYYLKGLAISESINDYRGMARSSNGLGAIYKGQNDFKKALFYLNKCLKISEQIKSKVGYSAALNNIGTIYEAENNLSKAFECYQKSLAIREQISDKTGIVSSLLSVAGINIKQNKLVEANKNALRALQLSQNLGFTDEIQRSANILQKTYKKMGNYQKGWEAYELYITTRDSMNKLENHKETVKRGLQYEFEKNEANRLAEQEKKDALASVERHKQVIVRNAFICGFILILVVAALIFRGYRQKQKTNSILVVKNDTIEKQKQLVEEKHKEITDSINYAERIQRSFLATTQLLDDNLKDYFIFFQPKDIVSGDFYWAGKLSNGNFALVTADSTGHGVPGAIMSILNISCLEKAMQADCLTEPAKILNHTRVNIIERLKNDGSAEGGKDGMDCSLVSFDFENAKLTYSSANNPVWIIRENNIIELLADNMPVGKHDRDLVSFNQSTVDLQKNDMVYTLTDGFPDQFGGPKGKKFMYRKLKELLISMAGLPPIDQEKILSDTLSEWRGSLEQVDDICVIGVRI
ncbi:tetratricopeptide repeat protein [Aurantibacillus circumpalustris]|uniref:tetratricopeptide repeat protein n=1 Tax=Aurantibacillus circumpalustris TaxID=3036359 RepID=UPI00295AEB29|nr:tetratricopeptide repeat protein [Aurantibacillus circumpalustris]